MGRLATMDFWICMFTSARSDCSATLAADTVTLSLTCEISRRASARTTVLALTTTPSRTNVRNDAAVIVSL